MITFFSKKKYLVDLLEGFVDIHNHILPGIDDGAKTVQESIELIKGFSEFGVKNFICTPHIMNNYYENTPETINESSQKLKSELIKNEMLDISIDVGAEHMIDDNFDYILNHGLIMPLKKMHLLVEMSYLQQSINFESSIEQILQRQIFPILAHPERYSYLQDKSFHVYHKKIGVKYQLNMLSLHGHYGKSIQKKAFWLLENGFYDFIGSDAHKKNHIEEIKKIVFAKPYLTSVTNLIENTIECFGQI